MKIFKSALANVILTPVLTPDVEDRNGDIISSEEIQKTAYEFILNLDKKSVNIDHKEGTDIKKAKFVESFIAPVDLDFDGDIVRKGTWLVGIQLPSDIYKKAIDGEFGAVSMEGVGVVEQI